MKIKRMAVFNDISGFGRCSLTASLPIITACGVECCPAVTAVLSRQTAFDGYKCFELTNELESILADWNNERFDGVYTGFFVGGRQIDIAAGFISKHTEVKTVVVDPVLGDGGELYPVCDEGLVSGMKRLVKLADVITPNLTELCILTDSNYSELCSKGIGAIADKARTLLCGRTKAVVVTGIDECEDIGNCVVTSESCTEVLSHRRHGYFSGTGDIFSSVLAAGLVKGDDIKAATESAARFVELCIKDTDTDGTDTRYGTDLCKYIKLDI